MWPWPELNSYDLMELDFGKLLGEDPKLTLAKIMGRETNPEASYLDIERSLYKKKGNLTDATEVPFEDLRPKNRSPSGLSDGLNLVRPVPKELFKYENNNSKLMTSNAEIPGKIVNEKSPVSSPTVDANKADSNFKSLPAASLLQKPRRFDRLTKAVPPNDGLQTSEEKISMEDDDANLELAGMSTASSLDDLEEADWARAEDLVKTGENMEVELLRSSTKGFMVSFGLLIGFLPFGNLAARWKFLAFESWLRQKGLDPSMYWQNLGVIGIYDPRDNYTSSIGGLDPDNISVNKGEISPDTKLEDLLKVYDQEKLKFFVYIY